jgi:hypothetical protein
MIPLTTSGMKEITTMSERFWASGHWQVKEGKAVEFIQQWTEWLSRSSENVPGLSPRETASFAGQSATVHLHI